MVIEKLRRIAAQRSAARRLAAQRSEAERMAAQPVGAQRPAGLKNPAAVGRWHAVSVAATGNCCAAARMIQRSRFLSAEAPALPLAGCGSRQTCRCFYKHHDDRRDQPRRREEITGLRSNVRIAAERRHARDRRQSDLW